MDDDTLKQLIVELSTVCKKYGVLDVVFHKTDLVFGTNLEVDLFLPELKTAIEIG